MPVRRNALISGKQHLKANFIEITLILLHSGYAYALLMSQIAAIQGNVRAFVAKVPRRARDRVLAPFQN
jgi:hypothetical protein